MIIRCFNFSLQDISNLTGFAALIFEPRNKRVKKKTKSINNPQALRVTDASLTTKEKGKKQRRTPGLPPYAFALAHVFLHPKSIQFIRSFVPT
jgi:hypothetical protein